MITCREACIHPGVHGEVKNRKTVQVDLYFLNLFGLKVNRFKHSTKQFRDYCISADYYIDEMPLVLFKIQEFPAITV